MYICICNAMLLCLIMVCSFSSNRSTMLPGMRSKMGRSIQCQKSAVFSTVFCWVQQRTSYRKRWAKYPASSWGTMLKMRHSATHFWSFILGAPLLGSSGCVAGIFCRVQKCPELQGKRGFHVSNLEMATRNSKWGSSKNGQNRDLLGRARPHFYVFGCIASIKKRVFEDRPFQTVYRWNHWKRSAKMARPKNAVFAPEGPKLAILDVEAKWSRNIFHSIAPPFPFTFRKTNKIIFIFLAFSLLDDRWFLYNLMIEFLFCNKHLIFMVMFHFWFLLLFCWCLCFWF